MTPFHFLLFFYVSGNSNSIDRPLRRTLQLWNVHQHQVADLNC